MPNRTVGGTRRLPFRWPISARAARGRSATDGLWAVNLCRDWKPDWAWSSLSGGYPHSGARFVSPAPAPGVRFFWSGDPTFPPAEARLIVCNPTREPIAVNASLDLVRNNMPELKEDKTLALPPGASQTLRLAFAKNDPTTIFDLSVLVTSADGKIVYYHRQTKWPRAKEPNRWVAGKPKEAPPLDFRFAYYPSKNKLRLVADINGLSKDAQPTRISAVVRKVAAKEVSRPSVPARPVRRRTARADRRGAQHGRRVRNCPEGRGP